MRLAILFSALAALAVASPYPQDDPSDDPDTLSNALPSLTIPIVPTISLNIPITSAVALPTHTRSKKPHWEPIPIFTKECKCNVATVRYPCWATDSLQVSVHCSTLGVANFEHTEIQHPSIWQTSDGTAD
jgi:hypothetical protein